MRPAGVADHPQRRRLLESTFSVGDLEALPSGPESSSSGIERSAEVWQTVLVDERQQVFATASVRLRGQWIDGRRLVSAAISSVAVERGFRGSGLGTRVMKGALQSARESGAALSALVPSVHSFYERLGYGIAGRRPLFRLATRDLLRELPQGAGVHEIRRAAPADVEAVAALADRRAALAHGAMDRRSGTEMSADSLSGESWVVVRDAAVTGWAQVRREPTDLREPIYTAVVEDLFGETIADEVALWREVVADVPAASEAEALLLPGGRLEQLLERRLVPVECGTWMTRVVNVETALRERGYAEGLRVAVNMQLTDGVLPDNSGWWRLEVVDGAGAVQQAAPTEDAVTLGMSAFSAIYMGYLDPVRAHVDGLIHGSAEVAKKLREIFRSQPAALFTAF